MSQETYALLTQVNLVVLCDVHKGFDWNYAFIATGYNGNCKMLIYNQIIESVYDLSCSLINW